MAVKNSLVKTENKEPKTFSAFLAQDAMKKKINEMVGGAKGQQFITSIISAVSTNPTLAECENSSIVSAALLGQSLELSPSPQLGQYYLVPFNKKVRNADGSEYQIKVAQFQLGYKGYIQLAIRSGYYRDIDVIEIREGEYKGRDKLTGKHRFEFIDDEVEREEKKIVGYMAYFEYLNGFTKQLYWSKEKMLKHADEYSKAFSADSYAKLQDGKIPQKDMWKYSSFWYKDFDGMAYKTMLRQLISKWGIMSVELQNAIDKDMAEIKEDGSYEYIDNDNSTVTNEKVVATINKEEIKVKDETPEVTETVNEQPKIVENEEANVVEPSAEEIEQPTITNAVESSNSNIDDFFFNE